MQEPGGANIVTYPRHLTGVVRKKDERRKAMREAHAQRKAAEAAAEQEQVKRLKSAKRREIDERSALVPCVLPQGPVQSQPGGLRKCQAELISHPVW